VTWEGRFTLEVSSADPDAPPVWVDFTSRVLDNEQPMDLRTGRQNDLDQSEPSRLELLLDNADDALSYGNTTSPYFSWWGPGRKCRLRETIAGVVMDRFTGYLQVPQEVIRTATLEQRVAVTAVDRLGRLQAGQPFISTLSAHILGSARPGTLTGYWPLLDDSRQSFTNVVDPIRPAYISIATSSTPSTTPPAVLPMTGPTLPGDDRETLRLVPGLAGSASSGAAPAVFMPSAVGTLVSGQVVTIAFWFNLDLTYDDLIGILSIHTDDGPVSLDRRQTASGGDLRLTKPVGTLTGAVNSGVAVGSFRWYAVAVRFGFTPNLLELWVDDQVYTATLGGAFGGPSNVDAQLGPLILGSVTQLQMYIGSTSAYTYADFLAARQVGLAGLERQTTGDRIRTIARYAGVPNNEIVDTIDVGQSVMQVAALADEDPLSAMRAAERTEQGLLYVDGSGNLVFLDRRSLYNI
jgi:hypothetical protein